MSEEFLRRFPADGDRESVVLVGVVHDHPASEYRVGRTVDRVGPDRLALELPPMSVPLFERHATTDRTPPAFGGEMSTAIQAARTDEIAGVDGPSSRFLWELLAKLRRERTDRETVAGVVERVVAVTKSSLTCRLAATVGATTGLSIAVDPPASFDVTRTDDPRTQAADERALVERARTVIDVLAAPRASRCVEQVRERYMADRIARLAEGGTVVGVVGIDHLDPVSDRLEAALADSTGPE